MRTLRLKFPLAHIEIIGNISTLELAKNIYYANAIERFERPDLGAVLQNNTNFPESISNYLQEFDLVIVYLKDKDNVCHINLEKIGVRNVISFDPLPNIKILNSLNLPFNHTINNHMNMIDYLLTPIISLGIHENNIVRKPTIYLSDDDRRFAAKFFNENRLRDNNSAKIVTIHPGSGSKRKNWPIEKFVEVAKLLIERFDIKIIVPCGPADKNSVSILKSHINSNIHVIRDLPLVKLAAILEHSDCFLGNDSGISHIAAAINLPSVLIFGPTNPNLWAPPSELVKVIIENRMCSICLEQGMQNCSNRVCLEAVTVGKVVRELEKCLGLAQK